MRMNRMESNFAPPGGESLNMVERRASKWLDDYVLHNSNIQKLFESKPNEPVNIIVFTHGMVIKSLLHHIMGFNDSMIWKISIDNTSVTTLYFRKEGWFVEKVNDTSHLSL